MNELMTKEDMKILNKPQNLDFDISPSKIAQISKYKERIFKGDQLSEIITPASTGFDTRELLTNFILVIFMVGMFGYIYTGNLFIMIASIGGGAAFSIVVYTLKKLSVVNFLSGGTLFYLMVWRNKKLRYQLECVVSHWEEEKVRDEKLKEYLETKTQALAKAHNVKVMKTEAYTCYTRNIFPLKYNSDVKEGKFGKFIMIIPIDDNREKEKVKRRVTDSELDRYLSSPSYADVYVRGMRVSDRPFFMMHVDTLALINGIPRFVLIWGGDMAVSFAEHMQVSLEDALSDLYELIGAERLANEFLGQTVQTLYHDRQFIMAQNSRIIGSTRELDAQLFADKDIKIKDFRVGPGPGERMRSYVKTHPIRTFIFVTIFVVGFLLALFFIIL